MVRETSDRRDERPGHGAPPTAAHCGRTPLMEARVAAGSKKRSSSPAGAAEGAGGAPSAGRRAVGRAAASEAPSELRRLRRALLPLRLFLAATFLYAGLDK